MKRNPASIYLYSITTEDDVLSDFGVVAALSYGGAEREALKHYKKVNPSADRVKIRIYPLKDRKSPGVFQRWGDYTQRGIDFTISGADTQ